MHVSLHVKPGSIECKGAGWQAGKQAGSGKARRLHLGERLLLRGERLRL